MTCCKAVMKATNMNTTIPANTTSPTQGGADGTKRQFNAIGWEVKTQ